MNYWMVKQEPDSYSWQTFVKDRGTAWTGVRNFQARNNLRAMNRGDCVLYYHTGSEKTVVGIARVQKAGYADPTATEGDWVAVDLVPVKPLKRGVPLSEIKADPSLKNIPLIRNPRLSVLPLTRAEYERIIELSQTE